MKKRIKNGKPNDIIRLEEETRIVFGLDDCFSFGKLSYCKNKNEKIAVIIFYRIAKIMNYSSIDIARLYEIDRQLLNGYYKYKVDKSFEEKEIRILQNIR